VKKGRITKSRSSSRRRQTTTPYTLFQEANRINGAAVIDEEPKPETPTQLSASPQNQNHNLGINNKSKIQIGRTWRRGALLSGVVLSVGAAILLSSSSTISWARVSQPVLQIINRLREQIHNKWVSS